ncbi:MAG: hypothetical protein LBJ00_16970 [Planctomycetaceae bacterium]|jgi:hypothetical protein|nr:hypothetical protein [Planctomycetaceae bacterium]
MMFGYLRVFFVFCTIILAIFVVGASGLRFVAIASEPVSPNTQPQNNSYIDQRFKILPNIQHTVLKFSKPSQQHEAVVQRQNPTLTPATVSQQNFRYIVPVAMQEAVENPAVDTNQNSNLEQEQEQIISVTKNPPTLLPSPSPQLSPILNPDSASLPANSAPLPATNSPPVAETNNGNPFQYKELDGGIGLVPRNISSLPAGIQVIGIMIFNDQKSIAAIRIPRIASAQRNPQSKTTTDVFYVHEGDIIEVPTGNISTIRPNSTTRGITNPSAEVLFLVVEKITPQHVEVRSRSNIADKHILR